MVRIIWALLLICSTTFGQFSLIYQNKGSNIPTDSLIAYYPFNGNANDESGNGLNGTIVNIGNFTLVNDRFNESSSAYESNGNNTTYIEIGNDNKLKLYTNYTISAWVKTTNAGSSFKGVIIKTGAYGIYSIDNNIGTYDWQNLTIINTEVALNSGYWEHLVLVNNSGDLTFYKNDTIIYTHNNYEVRDQDANFRAFGTTSASQSFAGIIDDVRLYNRVLTSEEITLLYEEQK